MISQQSVDRLLKLGDRVVDGALRAGAEVAEVSARQSAHLTARVRLGKPELVEEAASESVGLRVMRGRQVAETSTSDLSRQGLERFVEDALELLDLAQPDPCAGPPDPGSLSRPESHPDLDLYDPSIESIDADRALELALQGENAALGSDRRLNNSEGSTLKRVAGASALVTSGGFRGGARGTYVSLVVNPVADDSDGKKRNGYHWSARRHLRELGEARSVGEEAARRTLDKLGARKIDTREAPVIFDPEAGRSILGLLAGCVLGGAIWRKASFLVGREGESVAADRVTVVDDPLVERGPGSRPFDGEGLLSRRNVVVQNGVLQGYLLDTYGARKLERQSTASAERASSGGVSASASNFILQPGPMTSAELLGSTDRGLYVTDMMGYGFNPVTGDFSRGASGFWIEGGKRAFPVSEVTISLNLGELFRRIDAIADDLDLRSPIASPTFRVSAMTIAGR
jgi:PmbA protein